MRHYELLVILKPTLTDEEKSSLVENFLKELFQKNGALIEVIEDRGIKNLAYEIKKHKRGHYYVIYFKAPPNAIAEIERTIRFNENIIRFLTVKYENKKEIAFWEILASKVKKGDQKSSSESKEEDDSTAKKDNEEN